MDLPKKYTPIDCSFYDRIEAAIVLRKTVRLEYWEQAEVKAIVETKLKDTLTKNSEEFIILPSGNQIRMDRIISLDGEPLTKSC